MKPYLAKAVLSSPLQDFCFCTWIIITFSEKAKFQSHTGNQSFAQKVISTFLSIFGCNSCFVRCGNDYSVVLITRI